MALNATFMQMKKSAPWKSQTPAIVLSVCQKRRTAKRAVRAVVITFTQEVWGRRTKFMKLRAASSLNWQQNPVVQPIFSPSIGKTSGWISSSLFLSALFWYSPSQCSIIAAYSVLSNSSGCLPQFSGSFQSSSKSIPSILMMVIKKSAGLVNSGQGR